MEKENEARLKRQAELAEKRVQRRAAEYVPFEEQLRRVKDLVNEPGFKESLERIAEGNSKAG